MLAVALALAQEVIANLPSLISAGIDIASIVSKTRAVLTAAAAPDDPTWQALDASLKEHEATLMADPT